MIYNYEFPNICEQRSPKMHLFVGMSSSCWLTTQALTDDEIFFYDIITIYISSTIIRKEQTFSDKHYKLQWLTLYLLKTHEDVLFVVPTYSKCFGAKMAEPKYIFQFSPPLNVDRPSPSTLNYLCPNFWKMCLWSQLFILHPCLVVDKQVTLILNHCLLVLRWS